MTKRERASQEEDPQEEPGAPPDVTQLPPLGIPEGSVRALLSLILVLTTCGMAIFQIPIPDRQWEILVLAVGAYFVTRAASGKKKE